MKFVIEGRLDDLNTYINACRKNRFVGAKMKKENQQIVEYSILRAKLQKITNYPCSLRIKFYEKNRKRDIDNIGFSTKFILDALVETQIIENDSQKYVNDIYYSVDIDKDYPRVEVEINEHRTS